ncbi:MAG: hypothetical protein QOF15_3475 [Mycobacterium sp.]|nr:hypothetical protein [Mycobacterium sp.]
MGIPRPTGEYAGQMLEPGGWPEADEDTFYDRAQEYGQVLRKVADVMDATRHQRVEVFDGGVWSGGAANAADGALGANLNEMSTLQDYLATVITWHRHIGSLIVEAKSEIGNNVDGAQREIMILENDTELDAEERQTAINSLVRATHQANASLVTETAEQVRASKDWKPPHNALEDLLHQVTPPAPEVPTLVVPTPNTPTPAVPAPTPFEPIPANPYHPVGPGTPMTPVTPNPFDPANPNPVTPITPLPPSIPVDPTTPITPVPPLPPVMPVTPVNPPKPGTPVTPANPANPAPTPAPSPVNPAPVNPTPGPGPGPTPVGPLPGDPGTSPTPGAPGSEPVHVKPAAAVDVPVHTGQPSGPSGPSHRADDGSPAMTPAAATGIPAPARGSSAGLGATAAAAGASQSTGAAAAPSAGSRAAGGRAPLGGAGKAPATAKTRPASARTAPAARPAAPDRDDAQKDKAQPADDVTALPSIPVSAARAARDAVASASGAGGAKKDPLRLARRIAAALNARDSGGEHDYGFFWITGVTTEGEIVVANSYGLAYIPDGVELPAKVYLASADRNVPIDERARSATYPVIAVQTWAAYHDLKLRAVIGTAEQLANSDPGVTKVILEDDDIPESGKMIGRPRLEVVDTAATAQLQDTDDLHLVDLLPPAPADANAPDDERPMLWFDVMKPMTSSAAGREVAHLRAFHAYAAHSQELALHQAYGAADPEAQRPAVEDFMYWRCIAGLLESALTTTP